MKKYVKLTKQGKFYASYDDDAYVIHALMGYKISKNKTGFPVSSLSKVINVLEKRKVSYIIIENKDDTPLKRTMPENKYDKYCDAGRKEYEKTRDNEELTFKVKNLSKE